MKITLLNPPSHTCRHPEEHLGLACLKSYLDKHGFLTTIVDGYLCRLSQQEVVEKIVSDSDVTVLGVSPTLDSLSEAIKISTDIKRLRPEIFICWGGHLASFSAEDLLCANPCINCIVRGEGELAFLDLIKMLDSGACTDFGKIRGLAYRIGGKVVFSDPRELVENLESLPFPDRSLTHVANRDGALTAVSGSRGCYGNCSFCSINSLYKLSNGKSWRGRSAKNIVDELEELSCKFGYSIFKFVDDSFFGPGLEGGQRAREIAKEIIRRKLKIRYRISIRANDVKSDIFRLLKKSGLYAVSVGVESGVQRALNTFKKGLTVEENKRALKILKKLKIITLMGFIGFDPYMNFREVQENVKFLQGTKFCISDLVSKSLFVHAQDDITKQLIKDGLVNGRDFPNYTYQIKDRHAHLVLSALQYWNSFNKEVYYKISDPLTAPRLTSKREEGGLLSLNKKMREIDLKIYEDVVGLVKKGRSIDEIKYYLDKKREAVNPRWKKIEKIFHRIYVR